MELNPRDVLTQIIINVFRVNTHLLEKGNKLVDSLGITSARWRILGAIALFDQASCPQIVKAMGITRQGAQKQLNIALKEGLVISMPNPHHDRLPLYKLTKSGKDIYEKAMKLQKEWVNSLVKDIPLKDLKTTMNILHDLNILLQSTKLPRD